MRGLMSAGHGRTLSLLFRCTVVLAIVHSLLGVESASAAEEPLINCNQLDQVDRCDCNTRVLRAINEIRTFAPDPKQSANTTPRHIQDAVQQERLHRLRTFYAPNCELPSSAKRLPLFNERAADLPGSQMLDTRLRPLAASEICPAGCGVSPKWLLEGRWHGWQILADGKPSPITFHILEVRDFFVRACSNRGMVFGVLRHGFLELPGLQQSGLTYSLRFWRGAPPNTRDLEGVALLDVRPNET